MGMTIDLAVNNLNGILKEATESKDSVCYVTEDDAETLQMAIDIMRKYKKIIKDYETLADSLEKSGTSPKVCSKKIDEFCIDAMRGILGDYYADVLHEVVEDE